MSSRSKLDSDSGSNESLSQMILITLRWTWAILSFANLLYLSLPSADQPPGSSFLASARSRLTLLSAESFCHCVVTKNVGTGN